MAQNRYIATVIFLNVLYAWHWRALDHHLCVTYTMKKHRCAAMARRVLFVYAENDEKSVARVPYNTSRPLLTPKEIK